MSADAKTKKRTSQDKIVPADSVGDGSGKFADWQQLRHNAEPPSLKSAQTHPPGSNKPGEGLAQRGAQGMRAKTAWKAEKKAVEQLYRGACRFRQLALAEAMPF